MKTTNVLILLAGSFMLFLISYKNMELKEENELLKYQREMDMQLIHVLRDSTRIELNKLN